MVNKEKTNNRTNGRTNKGTYLSNSTERTNERLDERGNEYERIDAWQGILNERIERGENEENK